MSQPEPNWSRPNGWQKWRQRRRVATEDWEPKRRVREFQPQSLFIKGDTALQVLSIRFIKGDVAFASDAIFIKGDTSLIAVRAVTIKGDTRFFRNAVFIKGDVTLALNVPLEDLGEDPPSTKPGAISRFWLNVASVTKDVT